MKKLDNGTTALELLKQAERRLYDEWVTVTSALQKLRSIIRQTEQRQGSMGRHEIKPTLRDGTSNVQSSILAVLREAKRPMQTNSEIVPALHARGVMVSRNAVSLMLGRMAKAGVISRDGWGLYAAIDPGTDMLELLSACEENTEQSEKSDVPCETTVPVTLGVTP